MLAREARVYFAATGESTRSAMANFKASMPSPVTLEIA
jgi:hypothetical protein